MIHLAFNETVNVSGITFKPYNVSSFDASTAPKTVKLYVNRENMGFSDADDIEATQVLEIEEGDYSSGSDGVTMALKFVKFQRVNSITVFVDSNFGGDITCLGGLSVIGVPVQGTNMNELKKC
jgi:hypothetical protein